MEKKAKNTERAKTDWLGLLALMVMLVGASLLTFYYVTEKIHSCTSNPLKYTSDILAEEKNVNYTYAYLTIYTDKFSIMPLGEMELILGEGVSGLPPIINNSSEK